MNKALWPDWALFVILLLLSPFFLFPSAKHTWIFLIVPIAWILRFLTKKSFFESTIVDGPLCILICQVIITCLFLSDLSFSLPKIAGFLLGISLFYSSLGLLTEEKYIKAGIFLYMGAGVIFAVFGLFGMIRSNEKYLDTLHSIVSSIPKINFHLPGAEQGFHWNVVGGTLVLFIPLYIAFLVYRIRWQTNKSSFLMNKKLMAFLIGGLFITSGVLLLTQSRGSWVALFLSCMILMSPNIRIKSFIIFLIIIILVVSYFTIMGIDQIPRGFDELKGKLIFRIELWNLALETISAHPVSGIGLNRLRTIPQVGYKAAHAHNHLLHTAAELGIPGLIAYLAVLIGAGLMCYSVWNKSRLEWMRYAALGLGSGQLAHVIFGMGDSIPLGAKPGVFFWLSLSLIAAMYNYLLKNEPDET